MKRTILFVLFAVTLAVLAGAGTGFAAECNVRAVADGNDVLVPDELVSSATGTVSADAKVYAAQDLNGWFVRGADRVTPQRLEHSRLVAEKQTDGSVCWRAKGVRGQRFGVVTILDNRYSEDGSSVRWAKLETFLPASWIIHEKSWWFGSDDIAILVK